MTIAVDFDGTIVEHKFPKIGKSLPFVFETLKALQADGHLLILWTYRSGKLLNEAVEYCKKNGIIFYAVNKNFPEEVYDNSISRKILADIYIDDRNFGNFPDWGVIGQGILNKNNFSQKSSSSKRSFFKKNKK